MNKRLFFFWVGIMLLSHNVNSQKQNWRTSTLKKNSNYYEIVKKEEEYLAPILDKNNRKNKKQIKQFRRWAAFWKDRVLPDGSFVSATYTYNEWKKEQQRQNDSKSFNNTISAVNWTLVGPSTQPVSNIGYYPGMGRINTVAFNGTNIDTMYIGSPGGGIWKTTNGGSTWTPKGDYNGNLGVSHIVINPTTPSTLYLATGDWDGIQNRSIGVLKSTNSGDTWTNTGLTFTLGDNDIISKLLIDPNNVNTVFATTLDAIKRTTDGGITWTNVYTESGATFNDIQYKTGSSSIIYATSKNGKFYISTNNGTTWTLQSTPSSTRLDLAQTTNDANLIITLDSNGEVRKSTNQGSTWSTVSTIPGYDSQGDYNMALAISPLNKDLILVGGIEGWRSTDGGSTWEKYLDGYWTTGNPYFYVHSDHHDMLFIPGTNTAFSVNDGGIFKGDASLNTPWADLSSSLAITQYYNVSGTPQNNNFLIMGAQDNDITVYDGATFTGQNPGSDGVEGVWDYSNSNIAWTCSQSGIMNRTIDGFTTSQAITTPGGAPFVWELEIHPTIPTTILGGFGEIYKSTDRGDNWTNLNSGVGPIEFISIAPSDANVIYVSGENGDVKKTSNGGTTWQDVILPQGGYVKSIEIHPMDTSEIYIAYSGYQANKVYKSTNGGATWTNITGSLPNVPTHQIRYKTGTVDGELFLATDLGVYYRTNMVGDWVKFGIGLPNVIVHDIEIHYGTEKLRAATFGRGIWEAPIDAVSLNIEDNALPQNSVNLYPNPTINKSFNVELNNLQGESNILVYNVIGSVIKNIKTLDSLIFFNLSDFSTGTYIVKVTNNNKNITKILVVN